MAASELDDRSLQEIPTWAVALVCAVFIIISISIEHGILSLAKVFFFPFQNNGYEIVDLNY